MPTYIFREKGKKNVVEIQMKISELDSFKKKNPNLQQIPTAPSFRLKGTGWYETDFKTGNKKNVVKSDKETSTEKKDNNKNTKNENKKDEKKNNSKG
ncbi:MAG: FmdB family zinc ribbon protein [Gammaproteobacteria bacterium]|jgi:predicted nucleic acid-binding Zn ribbon protein|nr:FmdB family transcriptional regulator [Gammaproteobacteria bacterium]|tara:strand:- start:1899 stop:2189 length:291 start_codon:yes stop_codon:yes gene_type:complete